VAELLGNVPRSGAALEQHGRRAVAQLVEVEAGAVGELAQPRLIAMMGVLAPHAIVRAREQQPVAVLGHASQRKLSE
jgi:hypothetical protein